MRALQIDRDFASKPYILNAPSLYTFDLQESHSLVVDVGSTGNRCISHPRFSVELFDKMTKQSVITQPHLSSSNIKSETAHMKTKQVV